MALRTVPLESSECWGLWIEVSLSLGGLVLAKEVVRDFTVSLVFFGVGRVAGLFGVPAGLDIPRGVDRHGVDSEACLAWFLTVPVKGFARNGVLVAGLAFADRPDCALWPWTNCPRLFRSGASLTPVIEASAGFPELVLGVVAHATEFRSVVLCAPRGPRKAGCPAGGVDCLLAVVLVVCMVAMLVYSNCLSIECHRCGDVKKCKSRVDSQYARIER